MIFKLLDHLAELAVDVQQFQFCNFYLKQSQQVVGLSFAHGCFGVDYLGNGGNAFPEALLSLRINLVGQSAIFLQRAEVIEVRLQAQARVLVAHIECHIRLKAVLAILQQVYLDLLNEASALESIKDGYA